MFFIWGPRLDRAGKLVVDRRNTWDGHRYEGLVPAAEALEHTQPAAATIDPVSSVAHRYPFAR
jgi:uncharacterized protein DUF6880